MNNPRRIAVLSTGRQDYGVLRGILKLMDESSDFDLNLIIGGMHLSPEYGYTKKQVIADNIVPAAELHWLNDGNQTSIQSQTAIALQLMSDSLNEIKPEALVMVGDRFETAAAAFAATFERIPIVHLHGGEETEGAIDNVFRHAITKMSHLHLVSHTLHAERVIQMGEHPETVHIVGAPGLDNLFRDDLPTRSDLEKKLGIQLVKPVVIVTLHPVTTDPLETQQIMENLLDTLEKVQATYVITLPNTDPDNQVIREKFTKWGTSHPKSCVVDALGESFFHGLMREADLMVGNSSAALVEAPAYQLPAINIGNRQKGRLYGQNIVHVDANESGLQRIINTVLLPDWRAQLAGTKSPYGDGASSRQIIEILRNWHVPENARKSFFMVE